MSNSIYTRTISAYAKKSCMLFGRTMPSPVNYTILELHTKHSGARLNSVQPGVFCIFLKKIFKKGGFGEHAIGRHLLY